MKIDLNNVEKELLYFCIYDAIINSDRYTEEEKETLEKIYNKVIENPS